MWDMSKLIESLLRIGLKNVDAQGFLGQMPVKTNVVHFPCHETDNK